MSEQTWRVDEQTSSGLSSVWRAVTLRLTTRRAGHATWRLLGLLGGVYLAGVPTYYALFTVGDTGADASHARHIGVMLFVAWLLVAVIVGYQTLLKDSELLSILRPARRRLASDRLSDTVNHAIDLLLEDRRFALLKAFRPKVFVCDDRRNPRELVPFNTDYPDPWQRWPIGDGAVGATFERNGPEVLVFKGEALQQHNRSLTDEQLAHYGSLTLVAAIAVKGTNERAVGVLSVSSERNGGFADRRIDLMKLLASELGVLIDLLA